MGGSASTNASRDKSYSSNNQRVWEPQGEALQGAYQSAADMFNNPEIQNAIGNLSPGLSDQMQGIFGQAQGGMNNMLQGGSVGDTSGIKDSLLQSLNQTANSPSNTSQMYQSIVGGAGNTYIDPMVAAMKQGGMDNLSRMQASSGLDAAAAGQGGSSRHAMQNAMQGQMANQDMLSQEANMRGGAYDKDLAMKMNIAGLADSNVQGSQDRMMQMLGMADSNVNQGMNFGQQAQGLGMGVMAPYMQQQGSQEQSMNNYANVIGGPQVLGSGRSNASSTSFGASGSGGKS